MTAYLARYGTPAFLGTFAGAAGLLHGARVVARTPRGTELAEVLCESEPPAVPTLAFLRMADSSDNVDIVDLDTAIDLPGIVVDVETLFDGTVVVHLMPDEVVDYTPLLLTLGQRLGRTVKLYDLRGPSEPTGCGNGDCNDCGDCGGCSSGGCSRGATATDVAAALTAL
jgi:hypothetical protein